MENFYTAKSHAIFPRFIHFLPPNLYFTPDSMLATIITFILVFASTINSPEEKLVVPNRRTSNQFQPNTPSGRELHTLVIGCSALFNARYF